MSAEITDLEHDFLQETIEEVNGIDKITSVRVIATQDNFSDFSNIDTDDLSDISDLDNKTAKEIVERLQHVEFTQPARTLYLKKKVKEYFDSQREAVDSLSIDDLEINILLAKSLGLTTSEEVIRFYVYRRATHSAILSWQRTVEEICSVMYPEQKPDEEGFDIVGGFDERGLAGQGFWELVTGDEDFYAELIELIDNLSKEYEERYERSYFDLIENKISQLADDWEDEYGARGEEGLDAFVAEFTE